MQLINIKNVNASWQKGISLVEVLIALLVFSIGMLGVASLQVVSRKSSYEAQQRQEAVLLANEMVARMKASGQTFTEMETSYGSTFNTKDNAGTSGCGAINSACTKANIAANDIYEWGRSVEAAALGGREGLKSALGCVSFDSDNNVISVTVSWLAMTGIGGSPGSTTCAIQNGGDKQRHVTIKTYI